MAIGVLVLTVVGLPGCGGGSTGGQFSVVTSTPVLAELVRSVTGDATEVRSIMPAGTDPHGYQPSARDRQTMLDAGLLVINGGDLEEGLLNVIEEAGSEGVPMLVALDDVEAVSDAGDDPDPHFWHDPQQAAIVVRSVASRLAELDPTHGTEYEQNADARIEELEQLGAEVERILAELPQERRLLITSHDAYGYFAQRFELEQVGAIVEGRSSQAAPSAAHLADLARTMRDQQICVVFAAEAESTAWASSLAGEVGSDVSVVRLYAGTLPDDGYDAMLRENASRIATALGQCP